jgi:hypothetical protein
MANETTKVLKVARDSIDRGWSKFAKARDRYRRPTDLVGSRVHAVSMDGAVRLALSSLKLKNRPRTERQCLLLLTKQVVDQTDWVEISEDFSKDDAYEALGAFNDSVAKSKHAVLKVFDAVLQDLGHIKIAPRRTRASDYYNT